MPDSLDGFQIEENPMRHETQAFRVAQERHKASFPSPELPMKPFLAEEWNVYNRIESCILKRILRPPINYAFMLKEPIYSTLGRDHRLCILFCRSWGPHYHVTATMGMIGCNYPLLTETMAEGQVLMGPVTNEAYGDVVYYLDPFYLNLHFETFLEHKNKIKEQAKFLMKNVVAQCPYLYILSLIKEEEEAKKEWARKNKERAFREERSRIGQKVQEAMSVYKC